MPLIKILAALVPWSWRAACFYPVLSMIQPWKPRAVAYAAFVHPHDVHASISRRRGGLTVARLSQSVNDNTSGFHYDQEPRGTSYISQVSKQDLWERRQMRKLRSWQARQRRPAPNSRGAFTPRDSQENAVNGGGFSPLTNDVSANLNAMSILLKEMQDSQLSQSSDVQALTLKVADIAERLGQTEVKSRMSNHPPPVGTKDRNFGTSLDGEFHQKIKDVIDEFDMVDAASRNRSRGAAGQRSNQDYYAQKISQLESKIDKIDEALKETEERVNDQMEYMDVVVGQRLDEVDEAGADGMPFMEEVPPPLPPPGEVLPPPPPPPRPQEGYAGAHTDDGRAYYQERNYNDPSAPRPLEIPSAQSGKSANEHSDGHHYGERNSSFISSFSKADNERRREFRPFEDLRRTPNRTGPGEQLPRGPSAPFNRRFALSPPSAEPMLPGYLEGQDFYDDGPMMEEGYFFNDMYEF